MGKPMNLSAVSDLADARTTLLYLQRAKANLVRRGSPEGRLIEKLFYAEHMYKGASRPYLATEHSAWYWQPILHLTLF